MKHLLCTLLLFVVASVSALAQTPAVVVTSLDHITVNGGSPGSIADALTNHRSARDAILTAVSAYEAALKQSLAESRQAKTDAETRLQTNLDNQTEVVTAAEAALAAPVSDAQKVAAFTAVVAVAKQKRDEREAARREAEAAALRTEAARKEAEAEALRANP